ncbi:unnamed protein product [Mycena citricolor]|uniref:Uncharacterized protein n=1 Tax=Mycena citricolor TaxID=2018698 RepID=A0AAD2HDD2_9AGAR|nr:unnamed protein product [Mycena citricolor]
MNDSDCCDQDWYDDVNCSVLAVHLMNLKPRFLRLPLTCTRRSPSSPNSFLRRHLSSQSVPNSSTRLNHNTWIGALGVIGVASLSYACYDYYDNWRNLFPPEVRADLKRGIAAQHAGDREGSVYFKRLAWEAAQRIPIESFKSEPYLKLTGIAVDLAGELEENGDKKHAFELLSEALGVLRAPDVTLSGPERLRAVSIAVKMASLGGDPTVSWSVEEEEALRVWTVEGILKLVQETCFAEGQTIDFAKVQFPPWMTGTDIAVPLLELGAFYGKSGKMEYAMPLYVQTITLLVSGNSSPEEMCQGADLMNTLSELVNPASSPQRRQYAESWAKNALATIQAARKRSTESIPTCELALAVALFNSGMLRELDGDAKQATSYYRSAIDQSRKIGLEEGVAVAQEAITRLDVTQQS